MEGHPTEKSSSFCGRKTVEKRFILSFTYNDGLSTVKMQKKEEISLKDDDVPAFLEKKVKSA